MKERLSVAQLKALVRTLPLAEFRQRIGPYALIQQPEQGPAVRLRNTPGVRTAICDAGDIIARTMMMMLEVDTVQVATMPKLDISAELTVGRQDDRDLVIDDASVSKWHAVLHWDEATGTCHIEDTGSTNGTFVNVAKLSGTMARLNDGDIVSFGDVPYCYLLTQTLYDKLSTSQQAPAPAPPSSGGGTPIAAVALKSMPSVPNAPPPHSGISHPDRKRR